MDFDQCYLDKEASWSETMSTPIGLLTLTAYKESLISLSWETVKRQSPFSSQKWKSSQLNDKSKKVIKLTMAQLKEYFDGKRMSFEIPIQPMGTDFQKKSLE